MKGEGVGNLLTLIGAFLGIIEYIAVYYFPSRVQQMLQCELNWHWTVLFRNVNITEKLLRWKAQIEK